MASRTPTVGFVIDNLGHGGAQKQLVLLATALAPRIAARVYVLSSIDQPHGRTLRARGIPVKTFARRSGLEIARLRDLKRAMKADHVDVVHGFLDAANVYAYMAGRRLGRPTILSLRSERLRLGGVRGVALRWMLRRADAVTANSEAGRAFLVDRLQVAASRVHRIPNIVATAESTPTSDAPRSLVGCVGRAVALKRFDAVLRAFPLVRASVPAARLEIVGDGPELGALRALARELRVDEAVEFTGALDDATPRMRHFSCLVVASEFEGLPNAALEAMSLGVPVVAPPVGDLPSLVTDGVTGVVVRDVSPAALSTGVVRALTDAALRARAHDEAPKRIRERYSVEMALAAMLPLYERLSKRTGAAAFEATTPVLGE